MAPPLAAVFCSWAHSSHWPPIDSCQVGSISTKRTHTHTHTIAISSVLMGEQSLSARTHLPNGHLSISRPGRVGIPIQSSPLPYHKSFFLESFAFYNKPDIKLLYNKSRKQRKRPVLSKCLTYAMETTCDVYSQVTGLCGQGLIFPPGVINQLIAFAK